MLGTVSVTWTESKWNSISERVFEIWISFLLFFFRKKLYFIRRKGPRRLTHLFQLPHLNFMLAVHFYSDERHWAKFHCCRHYSLSDPQVNIHFTVDLKQRATIISGHLIGLMLYSFILIQTFSSSGGKQGVYVFIFFLFKKNAVATHMKERVSRNMFCFLFFYAVLLYQRMRKNRRRKLIL